MPAGPHRVMFVIGSSEHYRALVSLVDAADPSRVEFVPVATDDGRGVLTTQLADRGVPLTGVSAPVGWHGVPFAAARIRRLIQQLQPDVIHSNLFFPSIAVELARAGTRAAPPSVLCRHHNLQHHLQGKHAHIRIDRFAANRATRVIAVATAVARTLVEREHVAAEKIDVVHNGYDWSALEPSPESVARWRDRFVGRRLIVAAGRLDPIKDLPTLLRALGIVIKKHHDAVLVIAGDGPEAARTALRDLTRRLGLSEHVQLAGYVSRLAELVGAADVFAQASLDEACSQTISEAVGLAVPVAVTTTGGTAEIVHDVQPELPPGRPDLLAARIISLLDDPESARRVATAGATRARDRFSSAHQLAQYLEVYERVLTEGGSR